MPPTRRKGRMRIAIRTMPTPPIHCSSERQRRIPGGRSSRPLSTVEPVVVRPEIVSKKAST
jgi:hypothetical protein